MFEGVAQERPAIPGGAPPLTIVALLREARSSKEGNRANAHKENPRFKMH